MKNIDPLITAAELGAVQIPRFRFTLEDSLIRFSTKSSGLSNEFLNTRIPLTVEELSTSQNHAWATFSLNGSSRVKYLQINNSLDWELETVGAVVVQSTSYCQRLGLFNDGSNVYLYYPDVNTVSDFFQVKRVLLTSQTSNPISLASATNYGPQVPFVYEYVNDTQTPSLNHFSTIKAIMPVSSGLIVMTGDHNRQMQKIFITFYYVTASGYRKLATTFTGDIDEELSTATDAPMYSQCCAYEENGVIYVYFNTNQNERTAYFTINNGIESEIGLVIPIDKEDVDHNFACSSISKINDIYLLTGRLSFKNSDDTIVGFDTYLTSSDLKNWSVGESNCFISTNDAKGKIVYSNNYLYYLGNLYWARAVPNREIAPAATTLSSYDITDRVTSFTLNQSLNEADSFTINLNNQDLYFNSGGPSSSSTLYAEAGQGNILSQIGVYSIDARDQAYSPEGIQLREVSGRDIAIKKLNDWQSPIDMWLDGATQFHSDMTKSDGLIIKSQDIDKFGTFTTGSNFKFTGLNTPYMVLFDAPYSESSIIKTSVYLTDYDDAYHLSSVGFMLGAYEDEDKNFNSLMLLVPRERGGGTPFTTTAPVLRKLNLTPINTSDPEQLNTGLKYEQFISSLWRKSADENVITAATTATYEHVATNFRIPKATQTDLMVRLNGREIQLYSKERVRTAGEWSQNAEWLLKTVITTPDTENLYPQQNSYAGLVVSTDVSASKDWFAQGKYGDMVVQLSYANNYDIPNNYGPWTRNLLCDQGQECNPGPTGNRAGSEQPSYIIEGLENTNHLVAGMKVKIHGVSYFTGWYIVTIEEVYPAEGRIRIDLALPRAYRQTGTNAIWTPAPGSTQTPQDYQYNYPGGIGTNPPAQEGTWDVQATYENVDNYEILIYGMSNDPYFGEVSSQVKATAIDNSTSYINIETGAGKKAILLEGRGAVVTSDSTAMSIRHFDSDGIFHRLKSGDTGTGGSFTGFDETSPLLNTNRWKFLMYHGKFFDGEPVSLGCKNNGYVIVEDEVIRYVRYSSLKRGIYPGDTPEYSVVSICPSAYAPVKDASLGASHIENWKSFGGSLPGDQFDELDTTFGTSPIGMLVEVLSKNVSKDNTSEGDSGYYVKSVTDRNGDNNAKIELSTPLKTRLTGPVTDIDNPNSPWSIPANKNQAPEGDMVVVSGRAQFNTKKEKHNETSAVRYYPCNTVGESPYIKVNSTEYYHGAVITTEDIVKKIAAMAGVRNVKARTSFDDAAATDPLQYTLTSTPQSLPLQENMEDFTLEGDFYIPGNNIVAGEVSGRNELRIYFRNQYYIAIEQYVTASDYDAGYKGTLYVRLATTSGLITAFNSEKTIEAIKIRNKDSFSGAYSGSSPVTNATLTPNLSKKTNVKISVDKKFISVEINGKRAISFCIDEYILSTGASLAIYGAGPIQLSYKSNIGGNLNSVRVYGVGDPMSGYALRQDTSAKSAISEILEARHVFMRSTEVGGIEFGQFWNRDYFGNLHTFIVNDQEQQSAEQIIGHITYKSDKIVTNWIDEDWVIENGYKYLSGSGATVENSYYALREAKLMLRKQKESAFTREIEALPRLALQPEDEVTITHPNLPSGIYIIDSISINVEDSSSVNASYSVRRKAI